MSPMNSDLFSERPSEKLLNLAKDTLDDLGEYPHLKQVLEKALDLDPKPQGPILSEKDMIY